MLFRSANQYHCDRTFITNDTFLDGLTNTQLPFCNVSTLSLLNGTQSDIPSCAAKHACDYALYSATLEQEIWTNSYTRVQVLMSGQTVDHVDGSISYNLQSWISEMGGNLGLTLGFSALSLYDDVIISFYQKIKPK